MQAPKANFAASLRAFLRDPIRLFGVVSVVLVLVLAIAPAKDYFSEWRGYQKDYLRMIHGRGDALTRFGT